MRGEAYACSSSNRLRSSSLDPGPFSCPRSRPLEERPGLRRGRRIAAFATHKRVSITERSGAEQKAQRLIHIPHDFLRRRRVSEENERQVSGLLESEHADRTLYRMWLSLQRGRP